MLTYIPMPIKVIEKSVIFNQSKEFQLESVYKKRLTQNYQFFVAIATLNFTCKCENLF